MSARPILDLSHFIEPGMPVYPGTEPPDIREANTLENDGFREKLISLYSHTGTHMDAPAHILPGAPTLDSFPVDSFIGSACMVDVSDAGGELVGASRLEPFRNELDRADFLLLRCGWAYLWGKDDYFSGYPVLSREAALWLADRKLKGIGFDCISADSADSRELPVHRILLGAGMLIVENLCSLETLPEGRPEEIEFQAMPLKIRDADGSPVRAIARFSV